MPPLAGDPNYEIKGVGRSCGWFITFSNGKLSALRVLVLALAVLGVLLAATALKHCSLSWSSSKLK